MAITLKPANNAGGCCDCGSISDPCTCGGGCVLQCRSLAGIAQLCGFPEYVTPSTPPKVYRKQTYVEDVTTCTFPNTNCAAPSGGAKHVSDEHAAGAFGASCFGEMEAAYLHFDPEINRYKVIWYIRFTLVSPTDVTSTSLSMSVQGRMPGRSFTIGTVGMGVEPNTPVPAVKIDSGVRTVPFEYNAWLNAGNPLDIYFGPLGSPSPSSPFQLYPGVPIITRHSYTEEAVAQHDADDCSLTIGGVRIRESGYSEECGSAPNMQYEGTDTFGDVDDPPNANMTDAPSVEGYTLSGATKTSLTYGGGGCGEQGAESMVVSSGGLTWTLDDEDTDHEALERALTPPETWPTKTAASGTSFWQERTAGTSFEFQRSQVRVRISSPLAGASYKVTIRYGERPFGVGGPFLYFGRQDEITVQADADPETEDWTEWVDMPFVEGLEIRAQQCLVELQA